VHLRVAQLPGYRRGVRQVVGVRDPADPVGELLVVLSEVRRGPAVDGVADVLGGAHDDGENNEEEHGEAVIKTVDEVVIVADVPLR